MAHFAGPLSHRQGGRERVRLVRRPPPFCSASIRGGGAFAVGLVRRVMFLGVDSFGHRCRDWGEPLQREGHCCLPASRGVQFPGRSDYQAFI